MIRVWGWTGSGNVQKVMWALGELGLEHERIDAGGRYRGLDTEEYGRLNPNRRIPALQDGRVVLWESNVIVRYLAARYGEGSLWPADPGVRGVADEWMDWQQTTLGPETRVVFWGFVRTPPERRDRAAIDAAIARLSELWRLVDRHLASRSFVAGDEFTIGDIPLGVHCYRYHALEIERPRLDHVEAWYARLTAREAFRAHVMLPLS